MSVASTIRRVATSPAHASILAGEACVDVETGKKTVFFFRDDSVLTIVQDRIYSQDAVPPVSRVPVGAYLLVLIVISGVLSALSTLINFKELM